MTPSQLVVAEYRALVGLWAHVCATLPAGALALLEPVVSDEGPAVWTDGRRVGVERHTLRAWLTQAEPEQARGALTHVGLALLEAWRREPGPWALPPVTVAPVIALPDGERAESLGDAVVARLLNVPNASAWTAPAELEGRARWWLAHGPRGTEGDTTAFPEVPWLDDAPLSAAEALARWRQGQRAWRAVHGPFARGDEVALVDAALEFYPEELGLWLAQDPLPKVSKHALFHLQDPQWLGPLLAAGADPHATLYGRDLVTNAAWRAPAMLVPLLEAGLASPMPLVELVAHLGSFEAEGADRVALRVAAAQALLARAAPPLEADELAEAVRPLLQKAFDPNSLRVDWLAGTWPRENPLESAIPTLPVAVSTDRRKGPQLLGLPWALALLALRAVEQSALPLEEAARRLGVLHALGVDVRAVDPEDGGTLFHFLLPLSQTPLGARIAYRLLEPMGVPWEATNHRGRTALTQSVWTLNTAMRRRRAALDIQAIEAHVCQKHLEKALVDPGVPGPRRRL